MRIKRLLYVVLLHIVAITMHGQVDFYHMAPDCPDSLQKNYIRYFSPGKGGKKKVWNFSKMLSSKHSHQVMFAKDSTDVISFIENGQAGYYQFASDTLLQIGAESQKEIKNFVIAKPIFKQPIVYGDSICRGFISNGKYCGNHLFRITGTTMSSIDAEGIIVISEGDTIKNVKRVHTVDTYSICMDLDPAALDTARLTQVIDERYAWYIQESQYPIIENVTSTTYLNMDAMLTSNYACCNLDENDTAAYITKVEEHPNNNDDVGFDDEQNKQDIIHYSVQTANSKVSITYDLDEDATINTIVANHMGVCYKNSQYTQQAGAGYSINIDCSGLNRGTYILYINVNGNVYSEKITL